MRIVFFGTPDIAVPTLEAVHASHEIAAVVCQPDRPKGRGNKVEPPATKVWAANHGIPILQPTKLNDGTFASWLREQRPDAGVLIAYGRILKQPILDIPRLGILNLHPSLLPHYRGPSPIQSALLNGESVTGVTIMRLSLEMDAGDIALQETEHISEDDTGITLSARLARTGAALMLKALDLVESGQTVWRKQDGSRATYCRLIEKRDGQIDWSRSATEIHNLVRGAQPWPVAHCLFRGDVCRIHKTATAEGTSTLIPGTIESVEKERILVATGAGRIAVLEIQIPGKRAMSLEEYGRGKPLHVGEMFSSLGGNEVNRC
ncbi:MAG: methionyl-tRNA formyltransferase [Candidatus Hydrogenedentota bacterium]